MLGKRSEQKTGLSGKKCNDEKSSIDQIKKLFLVKFGFF